MLIIRLARIGKKKQPTYRLVISEKRKDTKGDFLEDLGSYNPRVKPRFLQIKKERILYWLSKGAQTSDTVHNLLIDEKVIKGPKRKVGKISKIKTEEKSVETTQTTNAPVEPVSQGETVSVEQAPQVESVSPASEVPIV